MRAAESGHDKCVQLLIDNGADVHKQNNNGDTGLIWAAMKKQPWHACLERNN
jgi:ankyrin repeat protein